MKYLYAPWRTRYAQDVSRQKSENIGQEDCVFCTQLSNQDDDNKNFVLYRSQYHAVMLNRFPYNTGHLLVIPYQHVAELIALTTDEQNDLIHLISASTAIIKQNLKSHGINVGANLEKAAGAGIPAHIHFHILPRWNGDTNFLPTLADTKQISVDLGQTYLQLKKAFENL